MKIGKVSAALKNTCYSQREIAKPTVYAATVNRIREKGSDAG